MRCCIWKPRFSQSKTLYTLVYTKIYTLAWRKSKTDDPDGWTVFLLWLNWNGRTKINARPGCVFTGGKQRTKRTRRTSWNPPDGMIPNQDKPIMTPAKQHILQYVLLCTLLKTPQPLVTKSLVSIFYSLFSIFQGIPQKKHNYFTKIMKKFGLRWEKLVKIKKDCLIIL